MSKGSLERRLSDLEKKRPSEPKVYLLEIRGWGLGIGTNQDADGMGSVFVELSQADYEQMLAKGQGDYVRVVTPEEAKRIKVTQKRDSEEKRNEQNVGNET